jgi:DNA-binding response OmpR family regulator
MHGNKILIVDDDKDFLNLLNAQLKASGYQLAFASDVPSAMITARKQIPDLILLDIGLPGGDGFMVMQRLRAIDTMAHIPIVVVTAQHPSKGKERAMQAGAMAYLQKPVETKELLAVVEKALGGASDQTPEVQRHLLAREVVKKILLVDDDKDFLQLLNLRLKNSGYQVAVAHDVPSALSMVQREKPDLILLDIGLPGGDGFVLMNRLKAIDRFAHIPIIIVTVQQSAMAKQRASEAGAHAYLQKPVDHNELLAAMREALGEA